jgi:Single-stranded DNA-specific exonuclease
LEETLFDRSVSVDGELTLAEIDREFLAGHESLQPFGAGNVQPVFLVRNARVTKVRTFAEECVELSLEDATGRGSAVLWPSVKRLAAGLAQGATADLLVQLEPDSYSPSGVRMVVVDSRPAATTTAVRTAD